MENVPHVPPYLRQLQVTESRIQLFAVSGLEHINEWLALRDHVHESAKVAARLPLRETTSHVRVTEARVRAVFPLGEGGLVAVVELTWMELSR